MVGGWSTCLSLRILGFFSLENRRIWGVLIEIFQNL